MWDVGRGTVVGKVVSSAMRCDAMDRAWRTIHTTVESACVGCAQLHSGVLDGILPTA